MPLVNFGERLVDAEQLKKERLHKEMEHLQAERRIKAFAKRHDWDEDQVTLVLQVLGLEESPPPLRVVSRR